MQKYNNRFSHDSAQEIHTVYIQTPDKFAENALYEPRCEKTGLRGFQPGPGCTTTQDG